MKALLTTKEAAAYLGYAEYTLRKSRVTGTLGGVPAPKVTRIGKTPRYKNVDLDLWIDGLEEEMPELCPGTMEALSKVTITGG